VTDETPFVPEEHQEECPKCETLIPLGQIGCSFCDWEPEDLPEKEVDPVDDFLAKED